MGPYSSPSLNFDTCCDSSMPVASNWDPAMLRDICKDCPSTTPPGYCRFPLIRPSPCPASTNDMCTPSIRESCKLPPITCMPNRICNDHPRDDCCRVPRCNPCPPDCTPAICVERTQRIKKAETYEPPCQPFNGCSLYRTQFNGCYGPPATSFKPTATFDPPLARMSGTTMYREQFTCKPFIPVERQKAQADYEPNCTPFEGCSTYRVNFKGCYGRPAQLMKPVATFDPSSAKLDGTSTYRHEFIPYCPAEYQYARGISVKPEQTSDMPCSPFSGCSTYRMDFPPKCSRKQPSMKPTDISGFSSAPFCARTTYRNDYIPFYFKDCCPDPCIQPCIPRCC